MINLKYNLALFLIILIFYGCEKYDYGGLEVKFINYQKYECFYSGKGWGFSYDLYYVITKGNEKYTRGEIIIEYVEEFEIRIWMIRKKLGKRFYAIKNGYPLSWHMYFVYFKEKRR